MREQTSSLCDEMQLVLRVYTKAFFLRPHHVPEKVDVNHKHENKKKLYPNKKKGHINGNKPVTER